ncbi:MAG TPA: patatin-like phospholipase family protein [Parafilimonas sp.]|nr:patatin-like phospholipase family protein [Parafilimonas sp.]
MPDSTGLLRPNEVEFLSFEGGGGKGNAFLGAVLGLQQTKVISFEEGRLLGVKGIAGSSAGALTALFLASGFDYEGLNTDIFSKNFNDFFDLPKPREIIIAGCGEKAINTKNISPIIEAGLGPHPLRSLKIWGAFLVSCIIQIVSKFQEESELLKKFTKPDAVNDYVDCFTTDFGVFSGINIHSFFNQKITKKISQINEKVKEEDWKKKWWTFAEHYQYFGIDLRFTSVNLRTENIFIFSKDTTPNFPVATAARMSMSLPCIFKPVIINEASLNICKLDKDFLGTWVDGGLFNNAPLDLFNSKKTILLRLGKRIENNQIDSILDFLLLYFEMGLMGSAGSGQINKTTVIDYMAQVIELSIKDLGMLTFNITDKTHLENLVHENAIRIRQYFERQSIKREIYE